MNDEMKYWDVAKAMGLEEREHLRRKISNLPMNDDRFVILRLLETIHQEELKHEQKGGDMAQDSKEYRREWEKKQEVLGRKKLVTYVSSEASQALADMAQWSGLKIVEILSRALVAVGHRRELLFAEDVVGPKRPQMPEASTPPNGSFGYFAPTTATYAHMAPERPRTPPETVQALSMVEAMAGQLKALRGRLDALERQEGRASTPTSTPTSVTVPTSTRPKPDPCKPRRPGVYKMTPEEKTALLQFLAVAYVKDGKRWNRKALYREVENAGLKVHATFGGFTNFITEEMDNILKMSETKDIMNTIKNNADWR